MRRGGHGVYLRHTSFVFLAAALAALLMTPIYQTAHDNARQNLIQTIDRQVQRGLEDFSAHIEDLVGALYALRYDTTLISLSVADDAALRRDNYLPLYNIQSSLQKAGRSGVKDDLLAVQFGRSSVLLLGQRGFADKRSAYGEDFFYYQDMDYAQYQARLFEERIAFWPAQSVYVRDLGTAEYLTFNQYYGPSAAPSVVISALLPAQPLLESILPPEAGDGAVACVYGPDGSILCALGLGETAPALDQTASSLTLNGQDYRMFRHTAMPSGLSVAVGVPEWVFWESVRPVEQKIALILSLALLGAVAYAALYSYIHFRPLVSLMSLLGPEARPRNLYAQIQGALSSMSLAGERLKRDYRRAMRQIQATAFKNACLGVPLSDEEQLCLDECALFASDCVLVALNAPDQDSALFWTLVQTVFGEFFPESQVYRTPWILAVAPYRGEAALAQGLDRAREKLAREAGGPVSMGVSLPFRGAGHLSQAAMQAQEALFGAGLSGDEGWQAFHPDARSPRSFPPFEQYQALTEALLSGAEAKVDQLFRGFQARLTGEVMRPEQVRQMLCNLSDAVNAALARLSGAVEPFPPPQEGDFPPEYLKSLSNFALDAAGALNHRRENLREGQIQQMMAFIGENFRDPNMSLSVVAQRFSVSEGYASQYIKRCTGKNYSAHLEDLRMNEAIRLLTQTDLPIGEIVQKTGFEYKNTFYKVFKKHFGVPPNSFREEQRE